MISPAAKAELTPTGKLRVGINFGNELLTVPGTMNDPEPRGVALDLAPQVQSVGYVRRDAGCHGRNRVTHGRQTWGRVQ